MLIASQGRVRFEKDSIFLGPLDQLGLWVEVIQLNLVNDGLVFEPVVGQVAKSGLGNTVSELARAFYYDL